MSVIVSDEYVATAERLLNGYRDALGKMRNPQADAKDALLCAIACALIAIAKRMPEGSP